VAKKKIKKIGIRALPFFESQAADILELESLFLKCHFAI
jgi:hypothetical protein